MRARHKRGQKRLHWPPQQGHRRPQVSSAGSESGKIAGYAQQPGSPLFRRSSARRGFAVIATRVSIAPSLPLGYVTIYVHA